MSDCQIKMFVGIKITVFFENNRMPVLFRGAYMSI